MRKIGKKIVFAGMMSLFVCLFGCGAFPANTETNVPPVSVEVGEHINMGSWQGEEIEWRVLDIKGDQVLLISEYVLDVQPYHDVPCDSIKWEDCTLRQWLNGTFYEGAFTNEEREQIILSQSEGFIKYNYRIPGKPYACLERETEDYIFVLSSTEKSEYLEKKTADPDMGDVGRRCSPTEYVKNNCDIKIYVEVDKEFCGWWLSGGSAAGDDYSLAWPEMVTEFSTCLTVSPDEVIYSGVRPAMWITWQE